MLRRTRQKQLESMTSDQVLSEVRKWIREILGDWVENKTEVWASHGYYYLNLPRSSVNILIRSRWNNVAIRRKALSIFYEELKEYR